MCRISPTAPALLIDFGGVITESVVDAFERACLAQGVDSVGFVAEAFQTEHSADSPFALVETGRITLPDFVERIAPVLARHATREVDAQLWLSEVVKATQRLDPEMIDELQSLYDRGVQTVLVSNSWGARDTYPWHLLPDFSEVVISGEVGLRKPNVEIYLLAANKADREPVDCLFVDDAEVNLAPARKLGMSTILHQGRDATLAEFRRIFR